MGIVVVLCASPRERLPLNLSSDSSLLFPTLPLPLAFPVIWSHTLSLATNSSLLFSFHFAFRLSVPFSFEPHSMSGLCTSGTHLCECLVDEAAGRMRHRIEEKEHHVKFTCNQEETWVNVG